MTKQVYKLPLVLTLESGGAYTVTSPLLPELVTAGATIDEALVNVRDAIAAVVELYEDLGRALPNTLQQDSRDAITFDYLIAAG